MLYFAIKAVLSGLLAAGLGDRQTQPRLRSPGGLASTNLDHGCHLVVAGHGGRGSDRFAHGSNLLVCLAILANVLADARDASRRRRLRLPVVCSRPCCT